MSFCEPTPILQTSHQGDLQKCKKNLPPRCNTQIIPNSLLTLPRPPLDEFHRGEMVSVARVKMKEFDFSGTISVLCMYTLLYY
ncbi:hypothetical protein SeLEV6574_g07812 [Synchytrium endobioticum]|uniref:Uncharacterized protein n=1 Tax=Synchytrium endobioticum TaxID=286115 RepID=A0A507CEN4_9FUNG|nr:hypothetical protein SeLEV6574_g07812 [Synchytrium endobioticum]